MLIACLFTDVESRDKSIKKLESKLDKVNLELQQEREAVKSAPYPQINVGDLERQIQDLANEKQQLHLGKSTIGLQQSFIIKCKYHFQNAKNFKLN